MINYNGSPRHFSFKIYKKPIIVLTNNLLFTLCKTNETGRYGNHLNKIASEAIYLYTYTKLPWTKPRLFENVGVWCTANYTSTWANFSKSIFKNLTLKLKLCQLHCLQCLQCTLFTMLKKHSRKTTFHENFKNTLYIRLNVTEVSICLSVN